MHSLLPDIRFALRTMRRKLLFSFVSVLMLGLGIGGTTAIFSVVDGVLLRDLPYEDPDRLVSVWKSYPSLQEGGNFNPLWDRIQFTFQDYLDLREGTAAFQDVAVFAGWGSSALTGAGTPQQLSVGLASANLFEVLGVGLPEGRGFLPGDDAVRPGQAERVVVLSDQLWQRRFGGDGRMVGNTISLDGKPHMVVGILPAGFRLESVIMTDVLEGQPDSGLRDLWMPLGQEGLDLDSEGSSFEVLGRLAPGVTPDQARAEVLSVLRASGRRPLDQQARVALRQAVVTQGFATPLLLLFGASAILLLIVCANLATLLLGEAATRRHEMAVRCALGAGSGRISRQLLTENLLLGLLGSGLGLLLALAGTWALSVLAPPLPRLGEVGINGRALLFAIGAGLLTGLVFGLAPVTALARHSIGKSLNEANRTVSGGRRWLQRQAVSLQIALTVVLLVSGGLFVRSLLNLQSVDPGFDPANLVAFQLAVPQQSYPAQSDVSRFFEEAVRNMEDVPGVVSVSGSYGLPFPGGAPSNGVEILNRGPGAGFTARRRTVLPSYHETMGIPLLQGRFLSKSDGPSTPKAMIISESAAGSHWNWPSESPLGTPVRFFGAPWTIVGVVGDVLHTSLSSKGEPTIYVSFAQLPRRNLTLIARTSGDPAQALPALQQAVWSVDPDIPVTKPGTMSALVAESTAEARYRTLLILVFGAMAALLAAAGVFSVTARQVAQRNREMGIRMALGAKHISLVGDVLRESLLAGLAGTALGLAGALWLSQLLSRFIFEVETWDPVTYGLVALLLVLVCLTAGYLPARRIARVDPVRVLEAG